MSHVVRLSDKAYWKAKENAERAHLPVARWVAEAIESTIIDVPTMEVRHVARIVPYYVELTRALLKFRELTDEPATNLLIEKISDLITDTHKIFRNRHGPSPLTIREAGNVLLAARDTREPMEVVHDGRPQTPSVPDEYL